MTRARATKSIIRARMARTGERYTAARRHVLATERPVGPLASKTPASTPVAGNPRGALSDAQTVARTGHDLAHWFGVLDRSGGLASGHTALARHLHDVHGVSAWYSQGITVAYERVRGGRPINQRPDGAFEFGASKIVDAPVAAVRAVCTKAGVRDVWTARLHPGLVRALADGVDGRSGKGFVVRSQGQAGCRFPWSPGAVELLLTPLPDGRTRVHVQHGKLLSLAAVEAHRPLWKAALVALAAHMSTTVRSVVATRGRSTRRSGRR